jgi:hypothetical protein
MNFEASYAVFIHHFDIGHKTAVVMLKNLCDKGWLLPSPRGKGERAVGY